MSIGVNGTTGDQYALNQHNTRTETLKETKQQSSVNDANLQQDPSSPVPHAVSNHIVPVNRTDKTDEVFESKNNNAPMGHVQLKNIASLVTIIKDSHKMVDDTNTLATNATDTSPFPPTPQSHGQLVMLATAANVSANVNTQFIGEIIDNFTLVDTNHDNLVTSSEAIAFIDKNL